jgi:hypothetical protein
MIMEDLKKIWEPIEILTIKNRLMVVEMDTPRVDIKIDYAWDKVIGDGNIIFEFNKKEADNYKLIGTVKQCMENPELLDSVIERLPKYEEVWDIPKKDPNGWEEFIFIDDSGRSYKQMGREKKYRRLAGFNYINYGIPADVIEYFPLTNPIDSFITLLRKNGIYMQLNDFIILKQLNYEPGNEE